MTGQKPGGYEARVDKIRKYKTNIKVFGKMGVKI